MTEPAWLTVRAAAARAQVSTTTVLRELRAGRLRGVKVANRKAWRLRPSYVDEWLERGTPEHAEKQQTHLRIAR